MKMVVNGEKICVYCVDCTHIAESRGNSHDYIATVKFCSNKKLTGYEKQCVREYIEYLIDEREQAKGEQE